MATNSTRGQSHPCRPPDWDALSVAHKLDLLDTVYEFFPTEDAGQIMRRLRLKPFQCEGATQLLLNRTARTTEERADIANLRHQAHNYLLDGNRKHLSEGQYRTMLENGLYHSLYKDDYQLSTPSELSKAKAYLASCGIHPGHCDTWASATVNNSHLQQPRSRTVAVKRPAQAKLPRSNVATPSKIPKQSFSVNHKPPPQAPWQQSVGTLAGLDPSRADQVDPGADEQTAKQPVPAEKSIQPAVALVQRSDTRPIPRTFPMMETTTSHRSNLAAQSNASPAAILTALFRANAPRQKPLMLPPALSSPSTTLVPPGFGARGLDGLIAQQRAGASVDAARLPLSVLSTPAAQVQGSSSMPAVLVYGGGRPRSNAISISGPREDWMGMGGSGNG